MPLDFVEVEKAGPVVEFFNRDIKTRPQHLEGEVIPELIHRVRACANGVARMAEGAIEGASRKPFGPCRTPA
jgi:hypothetical protein